ncbi:MAG: DUF5719 family protein [Nocardioides sp.]|uniref:DUF5719 family protein n=1 Tax=Nocardioides sp. TaxID=35761 RepID=UPI0039E25070
MTESPAQRGRRAVQGRRRPDVTTLIALALPVVTAAAVVLVKPHSTPAVAHPPSESRLVQLDRGCPPGSSDDTVAVANATGSAAQATQRTLARGPSEPTPLRLPAGAVATADAGADSVVLTAQDASAVGLVAARFASGSVASVQCPVASSEVWFTGVGARAGQQTVLQIANPDAGPAVVDVSVYSGKGLVDTPEVRGIRVPGRSVATVDLAQTIPRRGELAVQVAVSRGRAAITALESAGLNESSRTGEWLPGQAEPSTANLLLGLPRDGERRVLTLANPGESEAVVSLELVTDSNTFEPTGLPRIRVRPGSVLRVPLAQVLSGKAAEGATGVLVDSSVPLTAAVRSRVAGDLVLTPSAAGLGEEGAALLPAAAGPPLTGAATASLVLAGATSAGRATLTVRNAAGEAVLERTLRVVPDRSLTVPLPRDGALLDLTSADLGIAAAVVVATPKGATVVPVLDVPQHSLTAQVAPAGP